MRIEKFNSEDKAVAIRSPGDNEQNLEWANKFIKNFNDVYEKEKQSFFIKICSGQHGKFYVAFIHHPLNVFPMGNSVAIVNVDQYFRNFKDEFKAAYFTVWDINKRYLERLSQSNEDFSSRNQKKRHRF